MQQRPSIFIIPKFAALSMGTGRFFFSPERGKNDERLQNCTPFVTSFSSKWCMLTNNIPGSALEKIFRPPLTSCTNCIIIANTIVQ